ncbi:MAG: serine--tRNA ligase [Chloroflexota bacterium]|nr:serine--tRNA ligase [Chloroflexota bacterium]
MLDIRLIREKPDVVREALARRKEHAPLDELIRADIRRRELLTQTEGLQAERKRVSKQVPRIKDQAERQQLIEEMRGVGDRIAELNRELVEAEEQVSRLLLEMPNLPDPQVPDGEDDSDNVLVRQSGEPRELDFEAKPHWELGEALGIINFEQGQRISGSRFYVLHGDGSRLQRALASWMLDLHRRQGYQEVTVPYMVRRETLRASAHLPDFENTMYELVGEDFWLIPTSESPLTSLHAGEILSAGDLPRQYTSYSANFRREQISAGRDVRGIKRGHQFDKVEMYHFTLPEDSEAALDRLTAHAEETCHLLGLTWRTVERCTGDLGFKNRRGYDVEVWSPGVREWLEVSSTSNVGDFQARRAQVRFKREAGARTEFAHTLNGTGLGMPRTMIAVLENYQQPDGSVVIPEALRPYMGGQQRMESG